MLLHQCNRCGFNSRLFQEYLDHLWGIGHQTESRAIFLNWDDDENLSSLVVYAPSKKSPPKPSEVLEMFYKVSDLVVDFVFWVSTPRLFIVQFQDSADVERILKMLRDKAEGLSICGEYVGLRRKSDVLQHEWPILIGNGVAEEGSSKDPVVIELSDSSEEDNESSQDVEHASLEKQENIPNGNSDQGNGERLNSQLSEASAQPSNGHGNNGMESEDAVETEEMEVNTVQDDQDSDTTSNATSQDENISDEKIMTKISEKFVKSFLSKVKQESSDDKRKVNENLRWMEKKWTEIYLNFHNKFWPICFVMSNSNVKMKKVDDIGFEAKFKCECLRSESSKWLRKKFESSEEYSQQVKTKVQEFRLLLQNETECNRRLKQLADCRRPQKPILAFMCHIIVTFNNSSNTTAELTIKNIEGKRLSEKIKLVKTIFNESFREYERIKIKKWSAAEDEPALQACKEWTTLVTVE